jgi:hypothetical protein
MRSSLLLIPLLLSSCAAVESVLDYPMSFFDEETGEVVEEVALGDVIADNADGVGSMVTNALGGVNPLVALLGGGAASALLMGARRKKKAAAVVSEEASEADQA